MGEGQLLRNFNSLLYNAPTLSRRHDSIVVLFPLFKRSTTLGQ
jgi:hypothetical protein